MTANARVCPTTGSPDERRVACVLCGPLYAPEITVLGADRAGKERLTRSMPAAWPQDAIVEPKHVLLPSADGMRIHGDLWLPPEGPPDGGRLSGHVYVHGGPARQMRDGWHPMHP